MIQIIHISNKEAFMNLFSHLIRQILASTRIKNQTQVSCVFTLSFYKNKPNRQKQSHKQTKTTKPNLHNSILRRKGQKRLIKH